MFEEFSLPRLTPEQLQSARRASGRLGGRPRKPTADEARDAVLQRLMPKALKVLEQKIEACDQDSWRAAVKLIEYGWGRPAEQMEVRTDGQLDGLSLGELQALRARLLREHPDLAQLTLVE